MISRLTPPRILICGSLAYDIIAVFPDRFSRHLLPNQMERLSVSFTVSSMRREWGGCAGNIAYTLRRLGGEPVVMATLGAEDGRPYEVRLASQKIACDGIRFIEGAYTAQATIMTDMDDNQITAFHPGAMAESHRVSVEEVEDIALGLVAPDGREGMLQHARQFHALNIPFVFDPGQAMTLFSSEELLEMVELADVVALNDYEARLLSERTGLSQEEIARRVRALIITHGAEGSRIMTEEGTLSIPAVTPDAETDPTGCGDAYRAGLLYGIANEWDWRTTGRLAAILGAIKIAHHGPQNHPVTRDDVARRYQKAFGEALKF
ncbi:MAG: carbohydrate kinase family protein [Proteobacteria bacterium]|nr:carbohydrate kinase family protein [Pseudomonadota bacterium]MCL2308036.1 carbohydrate kinase family protein [Pseudomonadota bacterium]